jgi:mevalonate pyrophosphate decarboxylase
MLLQAMLEGFSYIHGLSERHQALESGTSSSSSGLPAFARAWSRLAPMSTATQPHITSPVSGQQWRTSTA